MPFPSITTNIPSSSIPQQTLVAAKAADFGKQIEDLIKRVTALEQAILKVAEPKPAAPPPAK